MTKFSTFALLVSFALFTSCDFIKNTFTYKDKTENFVEALMDKNYDECINLMATDHETAKKTNRDSLKSGLDQFRAVIGSNFGDGNFEYTFMNAEKKRSTIAAENTPPNTTLAHIEFSNGKNIGVFQILFDDTSNKIINIHTLDVKAEKPNMLLFWLFGILPLAVLLFNIYVIRQIRKSNLTRKWLKYLAVIVLNVPAISYAAVDGLSYKLLNFQILFGVGFSFMGYLGSVWTFGIPLGGIYWLWKLHQQKNLAFITKSTSQIIPDSHEKTTENM